MTIRFAYASGFAERIIDLRNPAVVICLRPTKRLQPIAGSNAKETVSPEAEPPAKDELVFASNGTSGMDAKLHAFDLPFLSTAFPSRLACLVRHWDNSTLIIL